MNSVVAIRGQAAASLFSGPLFPCACGNYNRDLFMQVLFMAISLQQFMDRLTQSGLMSAAEVASFQQSLPPEEKPQNGEDLAKILVEYRKLTKYQAQAV
jgi:hypothetical protein